MSTNVSKREWTWVGVAAALLLAFTTLPYLVGYKSQTPEMAFSGAVFNRGDYAVHMATMQSGARGEWLYRMRFTSEPQQGAYVKQSYLALGRVARALAGWTAEPFALAYQLARWVCGAAAFFAVYYLLAQVLESVFARRTAFLLAVAGSGLGWLQVLAGWLPRPDVFPIDFWLIDAYVYFGVLIFPHFAAVIACLAGMVGGYLHFLRAPSTRKLAMVAALGVLAQFMQPYAPALADIAMGGALLHWLWASRRAPDKGAARTPRRLFHHPLPALLIIGLVQIPLLLYNGLVFQNDPLWEVFARQNITLSPPFVYYLWGFGLLWPLALVGVRKMNAGLTGLLVWIVAAFVLAYLPWQLQRRFVLAMTVPLAALAAHGLHEQIFPWFSAHAPAWLVRRKVSLVLLLIAVSAFSNLLITLNYTLQVSQQAADLFDPLELRTAVDWLSENAAPDDVVLALPQTGLLVAARGGLVAYTGHAIETLDYETKNAQVIRFFSGEMPANEAAAWLPATRSQWVLSGPYEYALSGSPPTDLLEEAYRYDGVVIYRINN